ncbi:uncharacterized protein [Clytia hemisphaerica]|uniref:Uncharacterized protein n=1 Tax=Clytia hemisphaerica TaxID=252671 RepID=A0A7M5X0C4_9CNID
MMHNITLNSNSSSWCVELPTRSGGTTSFCNITEEWVPRFTSEAVYIVPPTLSLFFLILFIVFKITCVEACGGLKVGDFIKDAFSWKWYCGEKLSDKDKEIVNKYRYGDDDTSIKLLPANVQSNQETMIPPLNSIHDLTEDEKKHLHWVRNRDNPARVEFGCCDKCCGTCFTVDTGVHFTILLALGGILYDIYDVYTDCEYHYKYENFGQVHRGIYRDGAVSVSILVFAIFGMAKVILTSIYVICAHLDNKLRLGTYNVLTSFKYFDNVILFIVEDCAENFLNYFYIEKYSLGEAISHTMISKIFINFLKYGYKFYKGMKKSCKEWKNLKETEDNREVFSYFIYEVDPTLSGRYNQLILDMHLRILFVHIPSIFMCAGNFLRLFGVFYQSHYGKLDDHCVAVVNGRLIQTPFTSYPGNCMRRWEYIFMVCNFAPLLFYILGLIRIIYQYIKQIIHQK